MTNFVKRGQFGLLFEAEVAPRGQSRFEKRYQSATGHVVTAGSTQHYQHQPNKWGTELRVYFNDPGMAASLEAAGVHVEQRRKGYMAGQYQYRFNDSKLWWTLVEKYGLRLGVN